ncbi:MAG TPA: hypothetical protein DD761_10360 [Cyanobacteria bacterium UBA11691]|nr:hypothetical protein [Cyanobacteria bacterium UBA11691]
MLLAAMNIKNTFSPFSITRVLTFLFLLFSLVNLIIQLAKYGFNYRQEWMVIFNMDREMNFPTLYTVLLLAFCSFLFKLIFQLEKREKFPFASYWRVLHFIFAFMALDEGLQIHEIMIVPEVGKHLPAIFSAVWVIPYGVLTLGLIYYFSKFVNHLPRQIKKMTIAAGSLYVFGVLGLEMMGSIWIRIAGGMQNLVYSLLASTEEMLEVTGLIVLIHALLIYITKYHRQSIEITFDIQSQP